MKVSFSVALKPDSGKQVFACRLADAMRKKGVKIVEKKPDVNIVIVKGTKKGCKNILRLDGVWMNSRVQWKEKNKKIRSHLMNCEGVIYQNEFCKEASDKLLGKTPQPWACIGNGIDPIVFSNINKLVHPKPYFMAMCKWRPHKRIHDIVKGFLASGLEHNYDLMVFGDVEKPIKHPSIIYRGKQKNTRLLKALSSCVGTVHLAFVDWCPNSVVESIAAKKPVLHTDSGGTKLIVKNNGIMIKERKPWNFSIIDLYDPPALDIDEIGEGYKKLTELEPIPNRPDLHINTIADEYITFIKKVMS